MNEKPLSRKNTARYAGLLYLLMAITSAFGLMTIPSKILVKGNALQTMQNLLANEATVRWVMVSNLTSHVLFLLLVMTLYRLLKSVHAHSGQLMVLFVVTQVPLIFVGESFTLAALHTAKGEFLQSFAALEKADTITILLNLRRNCLIAAQVFWGLWLIPLGGLSYSSGFIPRVLGIMLVAGGFAYLLQTALYLISPDWNMGLLSFVYPIHTIAEISMILWLLIMGTTDKTSHTSSLPLS